MEKLKTRFHKVVPWSSYERQGQQNENPPTRRTRRASRRNTTWSDELATGIARAASGVIMCLVWPRTRKMSLVSAEWRELTRRRLRRIKGLGHGGGGAWRWSGYCCHGAAAAAAAAAVTSLGLSTPGGQKEWSAPPPPKVVTWVSSVWFSVKYTTACGCAEPTTLQCYDNALRVWPSGGTLRPLALGPVAPISVNCTVRWLTDFTLLLLADVATHVPHQPTAVA